MYYFASDIHLGAGDEHSARAVERRFVAWLDKVSGDAEAIFLVGDIFDFWFEYRRVVPKGFVRTLGKLAALTDTTCGAATTSRVSAGWRSAPLRR